MSSSRSRMTPLVVESCSTKNSLPSLIVKRQRTHNTTTMAKRGCEAASALKQDCEQMSVHGCLFTGTYTFYMGRSGTVPGKVGSR